MLRVFYRVAGLLCIAVVVPTLAFGQSAGPTPAKVNEPRAAATQLRSVLVEKIDGGYSITLAGNGPLFGASVEEAKDLPPRVFLDFHRVTVGSAPAITNVKNDDIDRVRVANHSRDPLITRVVIDLTRKIPFTVEQIGDELRVLFKPAVDKPVAAASPAGARIETPAELVPLIEPPVLPSSLPITAPAGAPAAETPVESRFASDLTQPSPVAAVTAVLFRVFLSDGRVLSSYGEWARLGDRVIFSMPTQLTRDPIELHLVTIASQRVDWPRTEAYAESVRAAVYAASRGDADFDAFTTDVAKVLDDVAKIRDPAARLATAEHARQKLAEWPRSHYGYRAGEVRDALAVLDEIIAQLRLSMGITRFDLSLSASAPLAAPPPPPLPPPTDAELVEQFAAAASIADSPTERISLLQTVMRLIDRAIGIMPAEWASRMRATIAGDLDRELRAEKAYDDLRTRTLQQAAKLASSGKMSDLERLRDHVKDEDRRLGGQRAGDVAALLATIDLQSASVIAKREARDEWQRRAPVFRRYRRSTNAAFKVFGEAMVALEQIKTMNGPPVHSIAPMTKRLSAASRSFKKVTAPDELAPNHELIASAWDLADTAFDLRLEAVSANSVDVAQRASSAAAGALMLYRRARADQLTAMEPPATK